ncbi:unnamed protein product [Acanthoscelides obtectus]|uniref:PIH1D1/2/3 CS-like domain-containing protein n=1 Tax=Acanthoscelides obtectus TaxID=200917 RepID=A0A9P0JZ71_ACAOB|nr:unnamed protein product [Acanthoscelides obtectus]CAK1642191.1 Protein PIH1D3 [Acanthoscelides obtectus]
MTEICEIENLVNLFNPTTRDSDSGEEDDRRKKQTRSNDGVICDSLESKSGEKKKVNPYSKIATDKNRREILDPENDDLYFDDDLKEASNKDWKKTPHWDITYKQQVTATDVFLQMGFKNPATASCEDMIITIDLPGENRQNMELKILKGKVNLVSPRYYLDLQLPHPVDPQRGNAKFDADNEKLTVTLRMDRELDFVNF